MRRYRGAGWRNRRTEWRRLLGLGFRGGAYGGEQLLWTDRFDENQVVLGLRRVIAQVISRDEDRPQFWKTLRKFVAQRESVHRFHDHVGDEQVDAAE